MSCLLFNLNKLVRGKWYETNEQRMWEMKRSAWKERQNVMPLRGRLGTHHGLQQLAPISGKLSSCFLQSPPRAPGSAKMTSHLSIFWISTVRGNTKGTGKQPQGPDYAAKGEMMAWTALGGYLPRPENHLPECQKWTGASLGKHAILRGPYFLCSV